MPANLEAPSVFLAAPSDLREFRLKFKQSVDRLFLDAADQTNLSVYTWEDHDEKIDQSLPIQARIPLPSDDHCKAVMCFFGERIGTPLPLEFAHQNYDPDEAEHRPGDARLVIDWHAGDEVEGGFALTGTVFEVLVALRRNAKLQSEADRLPLSVIFFGDETILGPKWDANWGYRKLRNKLLDKESLADRERSLGDYKSQVMQLHNFMAYLRHRGLKIERSPSEDDALTHCQRLIADHFGLDRRRSHVNPFKGLQTYDIDDADVFFGHEAWVAQEVGNFVDNWRRGKVPFIGICGASGVGKSSLLRAGWLAKLRKSGPFRFECLCVTTSELMTSATNGGVTRDGSLHRLVHRILNQLGAESLIGTLADRCDAAAALQAVRGAIEHLERKGLRGGREVRVVVGLDQFEELLDLRAERNAHYQEIDEVFRFILECLNDGKVGFVFTLQPNRRKLLTAHFPDLSSSIPRDTLIREVPQLTEQNIRGVISAKFKLSGLNLPEDAVDTLSARLVDKTGSSLLPLLSLTLERLFDFLRSKPVGTEIPDGYLSVETAVDALAQRALADITRLRDVNGAEMGELFRRMVRLADGDRLRLLDFVRPVRGSKRFLIDRLVEARLLIPVDHGKVRLVHESVMRYWHKAREWLDAEAQLLVAARRLGPKAALWRNGRARASEKDGVVAATLLWEWMEVFRPADPDDAHWIDTSDQTLREYCLAVLDRSADPQRVITTKSSTFNQFLLGIYYGRRSFLERSIESFPDLTKTSRTKGGSNAVIIAVRSCDLATLQLMLRDGDVRLPNDDGWQAVHYAAFQGNTELFDGLVKSGADPEAAGAGGQTALHVAAGQGRVHMVRNLLEKYKLDPTRPDDQGRSALHEACRTGGVETVQLLLGHASVEPSAPDSENWSAFHIACLYADSETVALLLDDPRTDVTATWRGYTPLQLAIEQKAPKVIAALLSRAEIARATSKGAPALRQALDQALEDGDPASVKALLHDADCKIDVNELWEGHTALAFLCSQPGRLPALNLVRVLLYYGADVNRTAAQGISPGLQAAYAGNLAALTLMVDNMERGIVDADERSALHVAARQGHVDCVVLLLDRWDLDVLKNTDRGGNRPLHLAADGLHLQVIKRLLPGPGQRFREQVGGSTISDDKTDINARTAMGATALHIAAERGGADIVEYLLSRRADPKLVDKRGRTALLAALGAGEVKAAEALLRHGVDVELGDEEGTTPLHLAAAKGMESIFRALLDPLRKLEVDARNAEGRTPLHLAAAADQVEAARSLLAAGADMEATDSSGKTPLLLAIEAAREGVFGLLRRSDANLLAQANDGATALHLACSAKSADIFADVLGSGVIAPDATGNDASTPLHVVAKASQNPEYATALLERKAALEARDADSRTPLLVALRERAVELAGFLMERGAALDAEDRDGHTVLHYAIMCGAKAVYRKVLDTARTDIDDPMVDGSTPLHLAAQRGDLALTEELLVRGAARESANGKAQTPLLAALEHGAIEAALLLISKGVALDVCDASGRTAMHYAAQKNSPEVLRKVLGWNDINLKTKEGWSTLHIAVRRGDEKMTRFMLQIDGIDANATDLDGRTPLHYAVIYGHESLCATLLQEDGVDVAAASLTRSNALHYAARANSVAICNILLGSHKIDRNAQTGGGKTALDLALQAAHLDVVRLLDG